MKSVALGESGYETSRLGYGCSRLMGSIGRAQSLALLEAAYEAGVRHFDTAPAYGGGQSESCLGEFLARRHPGVTVATKYGVPVHGPSGLKAVVRRLAVPVLELVPGLKQRLQRRGAPAEMGPRESLPFTAELVRASIDRSLRELRAERIDLFLLHEVIASDLADDGVLRVLEDARAAGKVSLFGAASGLENLATLCAAQPALCRNLQHEWSVFDPVIPPDGRFRILHRALTLHFGELHAALLGDPERARRWSEFCGAEVTDGGTLARLMLAAALAANPSSVILFSSKKPHHIQSNIAGTELPGGEDQALKFYSLVRAEAEVAVPGVVAASRKVAR